MRKWPRTIPNDLKCRLEQLLEYRYEPSIQTRWGEVLEWLEKHGVNPPDHGLPIEPEQNDPVGHW